MGENGAATAAPEVSEQQGATSETPSEQAADQSRYLTLDQFYDGMEQLAGLVADRLDKNHQGLQGLLDTKVGEIGKAFGVDRETAVAIKAAAERLLGTEEFANLNAREKLAALEAEAAKGPTPAPAPKPAEGDRPAPTLAAKVQEDYREEHGPLAKGRVEKAGLTWAAVKAEVEAIKPELRAGSTTRIDWPKWHAQVDAVIDQVKAKASEAEDIQHQRAKPPVKAIDLKPAGANSGLVTGRDALRNFFAKPDNALVRQG